jgi:3-hydroxyisobutyrate dehydrogenase-like beta-hydroxyacid dehydrogenase
MIRLQRKDLRLARESIQALGTGFPAAELALELFTRAEERGLGDLGTQGLIRLYGA